MRCREADGFKKISETHQQIVIFGLYLNAGWSKQAVKIIYGIMRQLRGKTRINENWYLILKFNIIKV